MTDKVRKKVETFVEIAGRKSTHEGEALSALRKARELAEREGKAIAEILAGGPGDPHDPLNSVVMDLSFDEFQDRMTALTVALQNAQKGYKSAIALVDRTEARLTKKHEAEKERQRLRFIDKGKNEDGSMPWGAFDTKVERLFGKKHGAMAMFARHWDKVRTTADANVQSFNEVTGWRKSGTVPKEAVDALATFKAHIREAGQDKIEWTFEMVDEVMALAENHTDTEMEKILSERWDRTVPFGAVKKARQLDRSRKAALRIYDEGVQNAEEIRKQLAKEFGKGFGGVSERRISDAISMYRSSGQLPTAAPTAPNDEEEVA